MAHLTICFIYQFLYHHFFGSGIYNFGSPSDVFSLSLRDVIPVYFLTLISISIMTLTSSLSHYVTKYRSQASLTSSPITELLFIMIWAIIIYVPIFTRLYREGYFDWGLSNFAISAIFGYISGYFYTRYKFSSVIPMVATLLLVSVICTAGLDAQRDRMKAYSDFDRSNYAFCNNFIILKNFSQFWLAVDKINRRIIINSDCDEAFVFTDGKDFHTFPKDGTLYYFIHQFAAP